MSRRLNPAVANEEFIQNGQAGPIMVPWRRGYLVTYTYFVPWRYADEEDAEDEEDDDDDEDSVEDERRRRRYRCCYCCNYRNSRY